MSVQRKMKNDESITFLLPRELKEGFFEVMENIDSIPSINLRKHVMKIVDGAKSSTQNKSSDGQK